MRDKVVSVDESELRPVRQREACRCYEAPRFKWRRERARAERKPGNPESPSLLLEMIASIGR